MNAVNVLEWTMGWAWPVIIGLVALVFWGVERVVTWNRQDLTELPAGTVPGNSCSCPCDEK
jgi:hypothetical protein